MREEKRRKTRKGKEEKWREGDEETIGCRRGDLGEKTKRRKKGEKQNQTEKESK